MPELIPINNNRKHHTLIHVISMTGTLHEEFKKVLASYDWFGKDNMTPEEMQARLSGEV